MFIRGLSYLIMFEYLNITFHKSRDFNYTQFQSTVYLPKNITKASALPLGISRHTAENVKCLLSPRAPTLLTLLVDNSPVNITNTRKPLLLTYSQLLKKKQGFVFQIIVSLPHYFVEGFIKMSQIWHLYYY